MVKCAKAQEKKKMKSLGKKSPLVILIAVLLTVGSAVAVIRFILIKPATIDVTVTPNLYEIEIWTAPTEGTVITNIVFAGTWIENDPSNELYPITPLMWLICADPLGPNKQITVSADGLPEGTTLVVNSCTLEGPLVEGATFTMDNADPYGLQLAIDGLASAPPANGIQITIAAHDFT